MNHILHVKDFEGVLWVPVEESPLPQHFSFHGRIFVGALGIIEPYETECEMGELVYNGL